MVLLQPKLVVALLVGLFVVVNGVGDDGMDRPYSDLPNMPVSCDSAVKCRDLCNQNSDCAAWAYSKSTGGCNANLCWLKNPVPLQSPNKCIISGVKGRTLLSRTWSPLPVGSILPSGWLLNQLELEGNGLAGYLDDFWPSIANSTWIGGNVNDPGNLNERVPYWLNGMVPLASLLKGTKTGVQVQAEVDKYINYILAHQHSDGWIGPLCCDPWPRFPLLLALTQYMEGNPQSTSVILPKLMEFLSNLRDVVNKAPLSSWAQYRWQDLVLTLYWIYDNHPELDQSEFLLDFAEEIQHQGFNWSNFFSGEQFPKVKCLGECQGLSTHGVNVGQALKSSAVWYRQSQSIIDIASTYQRLDIIDTFHGQSSGIFSCSEHLAGLDPSQGSETCTVVETMFSYETIFSVFGNLSHADRIELLAFNALPASLTPPMWAHVYLQQGNQINAEHADPNIYVSDGPDSIFGLQPNFGCCTANFPQGWPKFVTHMFMKSSDGLGIAAVLFSPSSVKTTLGSKNQFSVEINLDTKYPFDSKLIFTVKSDTLFPFYIRVPGWTVGATVQVGDSTPVNAFSGTFFKLIVPSGLTIITVNFPMTFSIGHRSNSAISIYHGPFLYGLKMETEWTQLAHYAYNSSDWKIEPTSSWNYALQINPTNPNDGSLEYVGIGSSIIGPLPFSSYGSPVKVLVKGRLLPEWTSVDNAASPPPQSPVLSSQPLQQLTLLPFGANQLRISEFPWFQN